MRILGVDFGDVRTGVAVSDPTGIIASGLPTIHSRQSTEVAREIGRLVSAYEVEKIVLGYPKNMNATLGVRAQKAEDFRGLLEKETGVPVILWDERLTTVSAHRTLGEANVKMKNRKAVVDQMAAVLILQNYLDSQRA